MQYLVDPEPYAVAPEQIVKVFIIYIVLEFWLR
jgi:hypothetical protein